MQTLVTQAPSVCREPYIPTASSRRKGVPDEKIRFFGGVKRTEGASVTIVSVCLKDEVYAYRKLHISESSERYCQ